MNQVKQQTFWIIPTFPARMEIFIKPNMADTQTGKMQSVGICTI